MTSFGNAIKQARHNAGFKFDYVVAATGIARSNLSGYENHDRIPNLKTAVKLARFYNLSLDSITGLKQPTKEQL